MGSSIACFDTQSENTPPRISSDNKIPAQRQDSQSGTNSINTNNVINLDINNINSNDDINIIMNNNKARKSESIKQKHNKILNNNNIDNNDTWMERHDSSFSIQNDYFNNNDNIDIDAGDVIIVDDGYDDDNLDDDWHARTKPQDIDINVFKSGYIDSIATKYDIKGDSTTHIPVLRGIGINQTSIESTLIKINHGSSLHQKTEPNMKQKPVSYTQYTESFSNMSSYSDSKPTVANISTNISTNIINNNNNNNNNKNIPYITNNNKYGHHTNNDSGSLCIYSPTFTQKDNNFVLKSPLTPTRMYNSNNIISKPIDELKADDDDDEGLVYINDFNYKTIYSNVSNIDSTNIDYNLQDCYIASDDELPKDSNGFVIYDDDDDIDNSDEIKALLKDDDDTDSDSDNEIYNPKNFENVPKLRPTNYHETQLQSASHTKYEQQQQIIYNRI